MASLKRCKKKGASRESIAHKGLQPLDGGRTKQHLGICVLQAQRTCLHLNWQETCCSSLEAVRFLRSQVVMTHNQQRRKRRRIRNKHYCQWNKIKLKEVRTVKKQKKTHVHPLNQILRMSRYVTYAIGHASGQVLFINIFMGCIA